MKVYSGNMGGVSSDAYGGVVHPVVPGYTGGLHLSLVSPDDEKPGYVVIAFDHDVLDDPDNPFGVDFIVFGNSGCTKSTTTGMTALDDPATCRLTASGFPEESVVEVAQNANGPWYGSSSWGTSDGFAPTLGHVYDPANADTNLYSGNLWWGAPTDPRTVPALQRFGRRHGVRSCGHEPALRCCARRSQVVPLCAHLLCLFGRAERRRRLWFR